MAVAVRGASRRLATTFARVYDFLVLEEDFVGSATLKTSGEPDFARTISFIIASPFSVA